MALLRRVQVSERRRGKAMKIAKYALIALGTVLTLTMFSQALAHKEKHTAKQLNVQLTKTGMACAMCHPFASDTHPHEFPKFQEQVGQFSTLRDMINWCIEKPNEGVKIDPDSPAMKALEAYMYWSNRGSKLDPGRH